MFVAYPTFSRRGPSGLTVIEMQPPSPREALEADALRRAGAQFDAAIAAQEEAGVEIEASLHALAAMTEVERAKLRFALRCDPELRTDRAARRVATK